MLIQAKLHLVGFEVDGALLVALPPQVFGNLVEVAHLVGKFAAVSFQHLLGFIVGGKRRSEWITVRLNQRLMIFIPLSKMKMAESTSRSSLYCREQRSLKGAPAA